MTYFEYSAINFFLKMMKSGMACKRLVFDHEYGEEFQQFPILLYGEYPQTPSW